jgi:ubiquitin conjugation factor E4 A
MAANPFETLVSPEATNEVIENVLLITLNADNPKKLFVMSAGNGANGNKLWTLELIELNLFERLLEGGQDNKVVLYLYNAFLRLQNEIRKGKNEVTEFLNLIIFNNISTLMKQPELFAGQNISEQILEIFKDSELENPMLRDEFLSLTIKKAFEDSDDDMKRNVRETFFKCFDECLRAVRQSSMISLDKWIMTFLTAFVSDKNNTEMAHLFLDYITLPPSSDGIKYADSLLGRVASSIIEFYQDPYNFLFSFRSAFMLVDNTKK